MSHEWKRYVKPVPGDGLPGPFGNQSADEGRRLYSAGIPGVTPLASIFLAVSLWDADDPVRSVPTRSVAASFQSLDLTVWCVPSREAHVAEEATPVTRRKRRSVALYLPTFLSPTRETCASTFHTRAAR